MEVSKSLCLLCILFVFSVRSQMVLQLLENTDSSGAVCLDGTPGGYYFQAAASSSNINDWAIYIQGGGWCYELQDCLGRSKGSLGSSLYFPPNMTVQGPLSPDPNINYFANWNHVVLAYCDGASFSGYRQNPVKVNGTNLYFRGQAILQAIFEDLSNRHNFKNAQNVLLTGCSAGGLATFFHCDHIGQNYVPNTANYKCMPGSGYFLDHANVRGDTVYENQMKRVFEMQNSTNGVEKGCISAFPQDQHWRCIFGQNNYPFITTPIMVLNSAYDSWQTDCIISSVPVPLDSPQNGDCGAVFGWGPCANNYSDCTPEQVHQRNSFAGNMIELIATSKTFSTNGNGAFIDSCSTHCEFQNDQWWALLKINGVKMNETVANWWTSPNSTPSEKNTYIDCSWTAAQPIYCNPTCIPPPV